MDLEMLERLGVTDADARRIVETASVPNTGNGPTHFIPAYDLMFYVNDINRENVEVLTQGSRYMSDTAYEYGVQRLSADHEGERETYLYDGRGSVVQLLKGGTVSQSYSYNAYGYINADAYGIHAPFFGYNGEEQNPFTGLQYLRARYYAPQNGGFITQDSFGGILTNVLSQNRYTYAENDPVNGIDPFGHVKRGREDTSDKFKTGGGNKGGGGRTGPSAPRSAPTKPTQPTKPRKPSGQGADPWMYGTNGKPLQYNPYTTMPDMATVPSVTRGSSSGSGGSRGGGYRNPSDTLRQAEGQTSVTTQSIQENSDWIRELIRNICDADAKRLEAQRLVDVETTKLYMILIGLAGQGVAGQLAAFVQGVATAMGDDFSASWESIVTIFGGSSSGLAGLNGDLAFTQPAPVYDPLFGHQFEMSVGRTVGHILTAILGAADGALSLVAGSSIVGGGVGLAPATGGAVTVPAVIAGSSVVAVGGLSGLTLIKEAVNGLIDDPNIKFSSSILDEQVKIGQSRGGRHEPHDLKEQLAMEEVIRNPTAGRELVGKNTDPRWPSSEGWKKYSQNINGVEVHYNYNPLTGAIDDVKIKIS